MAHPNLRLQLAMKKRKSSGAGGLAKSVKSETEEPSHVKQILQWPPGLIAVCFRFGIANNSCDSIGAIWNLRLEDEVFPAGGPDKYLQAKYPDQAHATKPPSVKT